MVNFIVANWWLFSAIYFLVIVLIVRRDYVSDGYIEQKIGAILICCALGLLGPFSLLLLSFGFLCVFIESKGGILDTFLDKNIIITSKKKKLKDELDSTISDVDECQTN